MLWPFFRCCFCGCFIVDELKDLIHHLLVMMLRSKAGSSSSFRATDSHDRGPLWTTSRRKILPLNVALPTFGVMAIEVLPI